MAEKNINFPLSRLYNPEELNLLLKLEPEPMTADIKNKVEAHLKTLQQKQGITVVSTGSGTNSSNKKPNSKVISKEEEEAVKRLLVTSLTEEAKKIKAERLEAERAKKKKLDEVKKSEAETKAIQAFKNDPNGLGEKINNNILRFIQDPDNDFNPYNKMADQLLKRELATYFMKSKTPLSDNEINAIADGPDGYMNRLKKQKKDLNKSLMIKFDGMNIMKELDARFQEIKDDLKLKGKNERRLILQHAFYSVLTRGDNHFTMEEINNFRPSSSNINVGSKMGGAIHNNKNLNIVDFFAEYYLGVLDKEEGKEEALNVINPDASATQVNQKDLSADLTTVLLTTMLSMISYSSLPESETQTTTVTGGMSKVTDEEIDKFLATHEDTFRMLRNIASDVITPMQKTFMEKYMALRDISQQHANERVASEIASQPMGPSSSTDIS